MHDLHFALHFEVNALQGGLRHQAFAYAALVAYDDDPPEALAHFPEHLQHAFAENELVPMQHVLTYALVIDHAIAVEEQGPALVCFGQVQRRPSQLAVGAGKIFRYANIDEIAVVYASIKITLGAIPFEVI